MTVTFEMPIEEKQTLQEAATKRARKVYGPETFAKYYWYLLVPFSIVVIGISFGSLAESMVCFLAFLSISLGYQHLYQRHYMKMSQAGEDEPDGRSWTLGVDKSGLILKSKLTEHHYAWSYFRSLEVTDNYLFLRITPTKSITIPKRAFPTEQAVSEFATDAQERIGGRN